MLCASFIILQNVYNPSSSATVPIDVEVSEDTEAFVQNTKNLSDRYHTVKKINNNNDNNIGLILDNTFKLAPKNYLNKKI